MKFNVSPGPDRFVYQVVESDTGFIWVGDLTYEDALSFAGELNDEADR